MSTPPQRQSQRTILVKYGGAAIRDPQTRARLMDDLAALHREGHRLIVVHGGGPQMTEVAKQLGIEPIFRGGRRVTDEPMLRVVQMVLAGAINSDLTASALAAGLPAVGSIGSIGGFVTARRRPPRTVPGWPAPVDFGLVADVASVDPAPILALWSGGLVPVLSSLVCDDNGQLLNLNADTLTRSIALTLPLTDLVYVADVPGVFADLEDSGSHIGHIKAGELGGLIEDGTVRGGMIAKLDEIGHVVSQRPLTAWIVGKDQPAPVHAAINGGPGVRTSIAL